MILASDFGMVGARIGTAISTDIGIVVRFLLGFRWDIEDEPSQKSGASENNKNPYLFRATSFGLPAF